jgi:hypothetical protein
MSLKGFQSSTPEKCSHILGFEINVADGELQFVTTREDYEPFELSDTILFSFCPLCATPIQVMNGPDPSTLN